jgi:hypothetical protein
MSRALIIVAGCTLSVACSPLQTLEASDTVPAECQLVRELSFMNCAHLGIEAGDLREFRRRARHVGGNSLQCCWLADESEVVYGFNPRSGKACTEGRMRFARVYTCPAKDTESVDPHAGAHASAP